MQANCQNSDSLAEPRTKKLAIMQMENISKEKTETAKSDARTACGMRETKNALMELSVDLFV